MEKGFDVPLELTLTYLLKDDEKAYLKKMFEGTGYQSVISTTNKMNPEDGGVKKEDVKKEEEEKVKERVSKIIVYMQ